MSKFVGQGDKGGEVEKMDNKRAIELLKQKLNKITELRTRTPEKQQYKSWFGEVCNILGLKFGIPSREYDNFARAVSVDYPVYTNKEKREKYNKELDAYETELKSAIHKVELEIEENTATNDKKSIYHKIWGECKDFVATIIAKFMAEKTK